MAASKESQTGPGVDGVQPELGGTLITEELYRRPPRQPDYEAENRALAALARVMAESPTDLLHRLVEAALELCRADSAGVCILEEGEEGGLFRWHAIAGAFAHNLSRTMSHDLNSCGVVVEGDRPLLFDRPQCHFKDLAGAEPPIFENLLLPFYAGGRPVGTLWAIAHTPGREFDAEDARLLSSLSRFASAAYQINRAINAEQRGREELERQAREWGRAEERLRESEEFNRSVVSASRDCLKVLDLEGTLLWMSEEGQRLLCIDDIRRLLGRPWPDFWSGEDRVAAERTVRAAAAGEAAQFVGMFTLADGCVKWFDVVVSPILGAGGEPVRLLAASRDITERRKAEEALRESEEKFRTLGDTAPALIWYNDAEGRNLYINQYLLDYTGKSADEIHGEGWHTLVHPDDAQAYIADYMAAVRDRRAWHHRNRVRRHDGEWHSFDNYAQPLFGRDGRYLGHVGISTDITAAVKAEEALRESEARLHSIANLVPDLLSESGPDGSTNWYNQRWLEYTGQTFDEAVGWGWADAIHPEDREASARRFREAVEQGAPLRQEHRVRRRDGEYRWFAVNAFPLKDEAGRVVKVYGAATDIHDQRVALEAIRESEERLHRALSIETVGVLFFNEEGGFTDCNEAFTRMSGYSREEMSSGELSWADLTPPEWLERSRGAVAELKATGRISPYEKEYIRKDGSRFWGLFAGSKISEKETVEYVVDVSARRRAEEAVRASEERLRLVVESVGDYAIITTDARGHITGWNSGAEKMFGYSEEDALGQHAEIIFTPEDRENGAPEEEMRAAREQGRAADERWHMSKRGVRFYVSGVMSPLRCGDGSLYGYAKIARDLTERKELEDALRRARDELEERVRERTLELAGANVSLREEVRERSAAEGRVKQLLRQLVTVQEEERRRIARELHDTLGQQLAALHMSIEMIKAESEGKGRLREHIGRTQGIFDRLNSDVDFLAWELRPAALDELGLDAALQSFVREWSHQFGVEAKYRGCGPDAPRLAPEVETNLYRILQEALQNVHKHAGADRVSVQLERRGGRVVLVVEDNGRGYDPDGEEAAGTNKGMGVTNMRERAALVGGELEIESSAGTGMTIYVRVPLGGPEDRGERA